MLGLNKVILCNTLVLLIKTDYLFQVLNFWDIRGEKSALL